ncbi:MAG: 4Fe-4S binding protein, partial [Candidatus Omnitrophica bacterium]|nr:4Fe-4S binding protein [Candidatus Omnitrophota bacterium]
QGEKTCAAAELSGGGFLECSAGCLGYGDCAAVCPFDAIVYEEGKLPKIIREKCTACGKCIDACPRKIISLKPAKQKVFVLCSTTDKGAQVRKYCKVGCIGCRICVKKCPEAAITMEGRIPQINPDKCKVTEVCIQVCPTKTIKKL